MSRRRPRNPKSVDPKKGDEGQKRVKARMKKTDDDKDEGCEDPKVPLAQSPTPAAIDQGSAQTLVAFQELYANTLHPAPA